MKSLVDEKTRGLFDEKVGDGCETFINRDDFGNKLIELDKEVPADHWDYGDYRLKDDKRTYCTFVYLYEDDWFYFAMMFIPFDQLIRTDDEGFVADNCHFKYTRFRVEKKDCTFGRFLDDEVFPYLQRHLSFVR